MKTDNTKDKAPAKAKGETVRVKVLIREGVETSAGTAYKPAIITLPKAEAEKFQTEKTVKIL